MPGSGVLAGLLAATASERTPLPPGPPYQLATAEAGAGNSKQLLKGCAAEGSVGAPAASPRLCRLPMHCWPKLVSAVDWVGGQASAGECSAGEGTVQRGASADTAVNKE